LVDSEVSVHRQRVRAGASLVLLFVAFALAGCGDDDSDSSAPSATTTTTVDDAPAANACPQEGCKISIKDVVREGDELTLTFSANFTPDFARNHIHVYWDTFTAEQVSDDAASRGVTPGSWHPTDEYPTYTTKSEAKVAERGESTTICVTTGDRNHNVIDATLFECEDVAQLL
jgi:hypothetical protein